jgi:phenol 2-monooxygenase
VATQIYADCESWHCGHGKAYEKYGIDSERGCLIVVRPDGYTALLAEIEDTKSLDEYFDAFLQQPTNALGANTEPDWTIYAQRKKARREEALAQREL